MIKHLWKICRIPAAVLTASTPLLWMLLNREYGYANPESCMFLIHYNSGSPLLKLIFDPVRTDWSLYQARELSYLIDAFDARFIAWCISRHAAHFLSLSSMIFFTLTIITQQYFMAKCFPKLNWFIAVLPSLVFSFAHVSSNHLFFRSSKPAVTFLLTLLFFSVFYLLKNRQTFLKEQKLYLTTALLALLLPMVDRQGFFFAGIFTVFSITVFAASGWKKTADLLNLSETTEKLLQYFCCFGIVSLLLSSCWNIFIAPELIMAFNGYYPSFSYQQLPPNAYFNFSGGAVFFFKNIGFLFLPFFQNLTGISGMIITILAAVSIFTVERKNNRTPILTGLFIFLVLIGVGLGNLMSARHQLILNDHVLYGTYFMPLLALFTCFLSVVLGSFSKKQNCLLLTLCIISVIGGAALKSKIITPPAKSVDLMFFYKAVAPQVIHNLNDPDSVKQMPLPFTNSFLIDFFRAKVK